MPRSPQQEPYRPLVSDEDAEHIRAWHERAYESATAELHPASP